MKTEVNNTIFEDVESLAEQYRVIMGSQRLEIKIWLNTRSQLYRYDVSHHYQRSDQGAPYISSCVYAHTSLDALEKAATYLRLANNPKDDLIQWFINPNF
ncbi:hypothetical protein [Akkermansia glycaniphila]|uniref:hypothetical protein n=1 Tax=Akkermansia glycaniphila TaxID=1679444 RepID=UPI001146F9C4|nr:hypothetical protein [Akkermansia glycaniphila]